MEVLVSALILAFALVGMISLFIAGRRYMLHSRTRMTSTELGRYFLDPLQLQVRQDLWGTNCLGTGTCVNPPTKTIDNIDYNAQYQVTSGPGPAGSTDVRKVRAIITWQEPTP